MIPASPLQRALTLTVHAAFIASFFLGGAPSALAGLVALAAGGLAARHRWASVALYGGAAGLLGLTHAVPAVANTWPLPALVAVGLGAAGARRWAPEALGWWRRGPITGRDGAWAAVFVALPGAALWTWMSLTQPDLSDLVARFGGHPLALYAVGALGFAMLNALAEEALFRGIAWAALEDGLGSSGVAFALQALAFGLAHINGFPRGLSGVVLAGIYGLMMGELRRRTGGLLLPWAAHVFADSVIAALLATVVYGV